MQYGNRIERVTSQTIYRFGRVGDNTTGGKLADGFPDMPAHDVVAIRLFISSIE
jgi:hypothetical protein